MKEVLTPARGAIAAALIAGLAMPAVAQSQLRQALETGEQATRRAEQVQEQINQLDDQRSDLVGEFRTLLQRTQAAQLYARQQEKVVESQRRELESLQEQLGRVDEIIFFSAPLTTWVPLMSNDACQQRRLPLKTKNAKLFFGFLATVFSS